MAYSSYDLIKFSNHATTTLASALASGATSLTVASGKGALFPSLTGSEYFYATIEDADDASSYEVVKVTARSSDTFTITRAQDGTSAADWAVGDKVELRLPRIAITDLEAQLSGYTDTAVAAISSPVSDTAYGSGWNGVTTIAPSKNAVYDEMELRAPKANPTFTGTVTADVLTATGNVTLGNAVGDTVTVSGTMTVAEESTHSKAITISNAVPGTTTNKLYNDGGTLYWNGVTLDTGGSSVTGTTGTIGVFTGAAAIGDSIITQDTSGATDIVAIAGALELDQVSAPGTTTDRLYNVGGTLTWNGSALGSGWSAGGGNQLTAGSGYIYMGTSSYDHPLTGTRQVAAGDTNISLVDSTTSSTYKTPSVYVERTTNTALVTDSGLWGNENKVGTVLFATKLGSSEANEVNGQIITVENTNARAAATTLMVGQSILVNTEAGSGVHTGSWGSNIVVRSSGAGTKPAQLAGIEVDIIPDAGSADGTDNYQYSAFWAAVDGGNHGNAGLLVRTPHATSKWYYGVNVNANVLSYLFYGFNQYNAAGAGGIYAATSRQSTYTDTFVLKLENYNGSSFDNILKIDAAGTATATGNWGITGGLTTTSTLRAQAGNFYVGSSGSEKFSVVYSNGNTDIAGTLTVAGLITASGGITGTINASTLNSQAASYYLDCGNFTGSLALARLASYPSNNGYFLRGDGWQTIDTNFVISNGGNRTELLWNGSGINIEIDNNNQGNVVLQTAATAGTITETYYITVNLGGTVYYINCRPA